MYVRPSILVMDEMYTVRVQSPVSFKCIGTGIPAPNITWYKSGNLIMASDSVTLSNSVYLNESTLLYVVTSTFSIAQVAVSDSGNYTCSASNPAGNDTAQFELNVIGESMNIRIIDYYKNLFHCILENPSSSGSSTLMMSIVAFIFCFLVAFLLPNWN